MSHETYRGGRESACSPIDFEPLSKNYIMLFSHCNCLQVSDWVVAMACSKVPSNWVVLFFLCDVSSMFFHPVAEPALCFPDVAKVLVLFAGQLVEYILCVRVDLGE